MAGDKRYDRARPPARLGTVTSVQLTAFCKRAAVAQQLTGCLTEIFFSRALQRAKLLDEQFEMTGSITGPFMECQFLLKIGLMWRGLILLLSLMVGARPWKGGYGEIKSKLRTNRWLTPTTTSSANSSTPSTKLISGGSSGGEGALVGAGGSVDIGGSIHHAPTLPYPTRRRPHGQKLLDCRVLHNQPFRPDYHVRAIQLEEEKYTFQETYLAQWVASGIDALLLPVTPWVGYKPKRWVQSSQWLGYSSLFNLLNYGAVTVPIGEADEELDHPVSGIDDDWKGHAPRNEADRFNYGQYDIDLVKGMPVTVQIVGGKFGEERAVSVVKVVDGLLGVELLRC
ncbi:amidase signature domain-containing protein [Aspergillus navahoensis]